MRKTQNDMIIKSVENLNVEYKDKLKSFIDEYFKIVRTLEKNSFECEEDTKYTINNFLEWLDSCGTDLLSATISALSNDVSEKMNGFMEYYSFLLLCSGKDENNLIDLLFSVPQQFAAEFG